MNSTAARFRSGPLAALLLAAALLLLPPAGEAAGVPLSGLLAAVPPGPHPPPSGTGPFSYTASMITGLVVIGPGTTNGVAVGTVSVTNLNPVTGVLAVVVGVALKDGNCTPGREITWAAIDSADYTTYTPVHAPARATVTVNFPIPLVFVPVNASVSSLSCILAMAIPDQAGGAIELMAQVAGKFQ